MPMRRISGSDPGDTDMQKNKLAELLRLMRPGQWLKSSFVFIGLLFSHAWSDPVMVLRVTAAAIGFSFIASAIYIVNDLADQEADRSHPRKRNRPLASGAVTTEAAMALLALLAVAGAAISYWSSPTVLAIVSGYAILNLAYSYRLKHVVILDVFVIATGFMLRIIAGTVGVGIAPSHWLLLCGLMITLFLGFAKRRAELIAATYGHGTRRKVLEHYGPILLDKMIVITASGAIITYGLYTADPHTIEMHHTQGLIYTLPFVIYAIFRYIFLIHHKLRGEDPSADIFKDPHILITIVIWLVVTLWLIR